MDHAKFQQRLNEVLDDRRQLRGDDELLQMAEQDADCSETLSAAQLLLDGVDMLDCPSVGPGLADRVLAKVNVRKSPNQILRLWVPICVAAALLLAAIPIYRFWQGEQTENPVAAGEEEKPAKPDTPGEPRVDEKLVASADSEGYMHRAGEAIGEAIWAGSMDQLTPEQEQWVERATAEIRPVADPMATSVAVTVDAVVRTFEPTIPRP